MATTAPSLGPDTLVTLVRVLKADHTHLGYTYALSQTYSPLPFSEQRRGAPRGVCERSPPRRRVPQVHPLNPLVPTFINKSPRDLLLFDDKICQAAVVRDVMIAPKLTD